MNPAPPLTSTDLKALFKERNSSFWELLDRRTKQATHFEELFFLSTLRKRAEAAKFDRPGKKTQRIRLALVGGYSLYPLHELLEQALSAEGFATEIFLGDFDNYASEIMDSSSRLYEFNPETVLFLPSGNRCKYPGALSDPSEQQRQSATENASQILQLCSVIHGRTRAEILLGNFIPDARFDLGPYRTRSLGSDWSYKKLVNSELGLRSPPYVHILDLEFLVNRRGFLSASDPRSWFESKQICSSDLMVDLAQEVSHLAGGLRKSAKKVLVLDLDNTLWGGVIGDDGLEGIEVGDTSPRGEAFKAFQKYIVSLIDRGFLLAVCSKNDHERATEPFEKHPEMVLKMKHFVSFKANWNPKSDNIREIAAELELGLDSFVFVDDNPAEIEIVRQFVPEVSTVLLGPDPAEYVSQLQDSRLFEIKIVTQEDLSRTEQYQQEVQRRVASATCIDMNSYLQSLEMKGILKEFDSIDAPRIAQLINKSNQFNLTTKRRTEAEVLALSQDLGHACFTVRLSDRFGDHGLISVVIGKIAGGAFEIDTWLMSCRVLKRQVEEEVVNEIARLAQLRDCKKIIGAYLATAKNGMVRDLYLRMGFRLKAERENGAEFDLDLRAFTPFSTRIQVVRRAYESN